jgi:charged multivesicular body protein 6
MAVYTKAYAFSTLQEISQMLGGQMSNQDEDEVEDELELLEQQVRGTVDLPNAPTSALPQRTNEEIEQRAKERARARAKARAQGPVPLEA